ALRPLCTYIPRSQAPGKSHALKFRSLGKLSVRVQKWLFCVFRGLPSFLFGCGFPALSSSVLNSPTRRIPGSNRFRFTFTLWSALNSQVESQFFHLQMG